MDVNFELGDLKFVWDSDKDELNWLKFQREGQQIERSNDIMNNSAKNNIPPLTEEQILRLYELSKINDDEIDFSDIPRMTKEELSKFRPARLRKQKQNIAS